MNRTLEMQMKTRTMRYLGGICGALVCLAAASGMSAVRAVQLTSAESARAIDLLPDRPAAPAGASVTRLPDGRWLLLGGQGADGAPSGAAVIVSDGSRSVPVSLPSSLKLARVGHTATVLPQGAVLILGGIGRDGAIVGDAELYDPATATFSTLENLRLPARAHHSATLLTDRRVLVAGGVAAPGVPTTGIAIIDGVTGRVEQFAGSLAEPRMGHEAILLPSAPVLLIGGYGPGALAADRAEAVGLDGARGGANLIPARPFDQIAPDLMATVPASNAIDVSVDALISARFAKPLRIDSLNAETIVLHGPDGLVEAKVVGSENGMLVFVLPRQPLLPSSRYTLFLNGPIDAEGRVLPFASIGFATEGFAGGEVRAGHGVGTMPSIGTTPTTASPTGGGGAVLPSAVSRSAPSTTDPAVVSPPDIRSPQPSADDADGELWIPAEEHFHGRWWTNRPLPAALKNRKVTISASIGETGVAGTVLRLNGRPLPNVTLRVAGQVATTDENGDFIVRGIAAGVYPLMIDGRTAAIDGAEYGIHFVKIEIADGTVHQLPYTVWMSRLDPAGYVDLPSPTVADMVITSPRIPGLELHIPAGMVIRDSEGRIVTRLNITAIPVDRPPFPLPDDSVPVYFTIQPGGATLHDVRRRSTAGARLIYPNFRHELPGARGAFWNYDALANGWHIYGMGTVSRDALQAIPDPGVSIHELTGAMFQGPNDPPPEGPPPCVMEGTCCAPKGPSGGGGGGDGGGGGGGDGDGDDGEDEGDDGWHKRGDNGGGTTECGGDPVSLSTGQFTHTERDLAVSDVLSVALDRTYNSLDLNRRAFGVGWNHGFNIMLFSSNMYQTVDLVLPNNARVRYNRISAGNSYSTAVFRADVPGEYNGSTIRWVGGWDLQFRNGRKWRFPEYAPISEISDPNGNKIVITRASGGQVSRIDSPNGRWIRFDYNSFGVSSATDNGGRRFVYSYDGSGRLISTS